MKSENVMRATEERPRLTREEQEVIITTSAADELAEVYTADPIYMRKLDKRVEQDPGNYKVKSRNTYSATYTMPKRLLQFRLPTAPRELTEEQRAELRERMKKHKRLDRIRLASILSRIHKEFDCIPNIHHGSVMKLLYRDVLTVFYRDFVGEK